MNSDVRSLSQQEIDQALEELSAQYSSIEWPYDTRQVLSDCISALGGLFGAQTSFNREPRRFYFFRVRNALSFNDETEVSDPKQYSYPPPKYCKTVGRAHIPGHPVFYGSDSYEGAIREMKAPDEIHYHVSCWYTDEISITKLNFLFANNISSRRLLENFERAVSDMWSQHNVLDDLNRSRMRSHLCAWSNLFTSDKYPLTSSISHQNMYGTYANRKLICYGSAIDGSSVNFALHPSLADQLKLHRVYSVSVTDLYGDIGFIQCTDFGKNGMLQWRQITEADLPQNDPFLPTQHESQSNA